jgi:hydrogenase nickel incorporation protein HypA/HybF
MTKQIQSLLDTVIRRADGRHITDVRLIIGELKELSDDAFQATWADLAKGTPAEGANLTIRHVAAELQCMTCFRKYHPEGANVSCPRCGSVGAKIIAGEEFSIEAVELAPSP